MRYRIFTQYNDGHAHELILGETSSLYEAYKKIEGFNGCMNIQIEVINDGPRTVLCRDFNISFGSINFSL